MLSIPSLRWLRFWLNLVGLGGESVHFLRAKLFSIQFPLPSRKFTKHMEGSIKPSGHVMAAHLRDEQSIGFTESEKPELTRYASIDPNGWIRLNLRGLAPRNEQDSDLVCTTLVAVISAGGSQVQSKGRGSKTKTMFWKLIAFKLVYRLFVR
jgi:hypothetical protein